MVAHFRMCAEVVRILPKQNRLSSSGRISPIISNLRAGWKRRGRTRLPGIVQEVVLPVSHSGVGVDAIDWMDNTGCAIWVVRR